MSISDIMYVKNLWGETTMLNSNVKQRVSVTKQLIYGLIATLCAVVLPQLAHLIGDALGVQTALGEILLPMHLPVIFIGLLAGPIAGGVAGVCSPLVSFALTGMPKAVMLPFILIEVATYGIVAGFLKQANISNLVKVILVQVAGRVVKAIAILVVFYAFDGKVAPIVIWTTLYMGVAGMAIQWLAIPYFVKKAQ